MIIGPAQGSDLAAVHKYKKHPLSWEYSGFYEIQQSPKRYRLIDLPALLARCGFSHQADFQQARRQWATKLFEAGWRCATRGGQKHLRLAAKRSSRRLKESWEPSAAS